MYFDHNPVELNIMSMQETTRGRGFWKLNVSLLKDKEFIDIINDVLDKGKNKYRNMEDKGLVWDTVKMEVRSAIISYSAYKAKQSKKY
jgi:hypothetical protein